ncbi:hypothetical protein TWF694_010190 [Orbilia ellipsospora]|uniref:Uncharacterized protein n=1 Tax=Orbilia ellipsospora TaxID=2528407 RepID=A0AAV9XC85_9PEZI
MASGHELYIGPCIHDPPHPLHLPTLDRPLRIHIEGPLVSIQKLLPEAEWPKRGLFGLKFPQPGGIELAKLVHQKLYGECPRDDEIVLGDEYLGWIVDRTVKPWKVLDELDYYGVTFDHLVPPNDTDPEVLMLNIFEMDDDNGEFANKHLLFSVDPADYEGKVLTTPRCCQKKKGSMDRKNMNEMVAERQIKYIPGTYHLKINYLMFPERFPGILYPPIAPPWDTDN